MNKKIIGISLLYIFVFSFMAGCNKTQVNDTINSNSIDKKDINPISKSTVVNILKAEYGDNIIIKDKDIRLIGDLYFVDVYVEVDDGEEDKENESNETHTHIQSLGTQKIDKYTGEIINE